MPNKLVSWILACMVSVALPSQPSAGADGTKRQSNEPRASAQDAFGQVTAACADKSKPRSADACSVITLAGGTSNADISDAYFDLGVTYTRQKDYSRAIANYTEAIRINPRNRDAFLNRGNAYLDLRDFARGIADYSEAIRIDPQNGGAFLNRGSAYLDQNDFTRGIADYSEAIRIDPQNAVAFTLRADAYLTQKDFARAIADYDQAIKIMPQNKYAIGNRRFAYDEQKAAAAAPPPSGQSVAGFQPSWIGRTMVVRGTVSRFVQKTVNGEPYIYLYFKERPDSTVVACSRDDRWLLGVLGVDDFQSVVGKTLEFNGEVVSQPCAAQGASLWIWQRSNAHLVGGSTR